MARIDIGAPYAYVLRYGMESHLPRRCQLIHPELADDHAYVLPHLVKNGVFLELVQPTTPGARRLKNRVPTWTTAEAAHLAPFSTDPVFVLTTTGILVSSKLGLPSSWSLASIPELTHNIFKSPGRLTAGAELQPITPAGVTLTALPNTRATQYYTPTTRFYLEAVQPVEGNPYLVVTHKNRGGRFLGTWRQGVLNVAVSQLGMLEHEHSVHVTCIPDFGWLIQSSSKAAPSVGGYEMPMPDLAKERVYGKREAKAGLMRGHIPFVDIPNACLQMAGLKEGTPLAIARLPAGGLMLYPTKSAPQRVRRTHREKTVLSFRLGVAELSWLQSDHIQAIAVENALYILDASVPNDLPVIPNGSTRDFDIELPIVVGQPTVTLPASSLRHCGFDAGKSFKVIVDDAYTELRLDPKGPWQVGTKNNEPTIALPLELLYHVKGDSVFLTRSGLKGLQLKAVPCH